MVKAREKRWSRKPKPSSVRLRVPETNHEDQRCPQQGDTADSIEIFRQAHESLIAITDKALVNCLQTHQRGCPAYPFDSTTFLPTRLLDLEQLETPKLVESAGITSQDRRYVCLSHQWGNPDKEAKLAMATVTGNLQERRECINIWNLPRRYQEAMMICHFLGVRYIWIDSLCIIQVRH
jgi:hypothetical protein